MAYKHGHARKGKKTKIYDAWKHMRHRCNNPNIIDYKNYGDRGIKVCERWYDFRNFLEDMGEPPEGLTLERIDNDKNYEPDNCKWATRMEQAHNKRGSKLNPLKVQVIKKLLKESRLLQYEIAEIFGVSPTMIGRIVRRKAWLTVH